MVETRPAQTHKDRAKAAAAKPAAFGEDIDLGSYVSSAEDQPHQPDPEKLPAKAKKRMLEAGIILDDPSQRTGTFIQVDNAAVHSSVRQEGVEVMAVSKALQEYDWLSDYWWRAVAVDSDK